MAKVNSCLKTIFILLNLVFGILGFLTIHMAVISTYYTYEVSGFKDLSLIKIWVFAIIIIGIAVLAVYAAVAENSIILKIFAVLMIIMMVICLILGIVSTLMRGALKTELSKTEEVTKNFVNEQRRNQTDVFQTVFRCCGVVAAEDWGTNIPNSCKCSPTGPDGKSECKDRPKAATGPDQIYSMPCKDKLYQVNVQPYTFGMGLFYFFVCFTILLLVLDFLMIRQIRLHDSGRSFS